MLDKMHNLSKCIKKLWSHFYAFRQVRLYGHNSLFLSLSSLSLLPPSDPSSSTPSNPLLCLYKIGMDGFPAPQRLQQLKKIIATKKHTKQPRGARCPDMDRCCPVVWPTCVVDWLERLSSSAGFYSFCCLSDKTLFVLGNNQALFVDMSTAKKKNC
jgi:hypothetical protein